MFCFIYHYFYYTPITIGNGGYIGVTLSVGLSVPLVRAITMSFIKGFWNHLAHMFTIIGQCVARQNYVNISKVKVWLWGQRSKMAINELVRAITMSFIKGFWNHLAHMFTIIGQCVARKNYVNISKVKVTLWGQRSKMAINELVRAITMSFIKGFEIILHICSPSLDSVSRERITSISQRSRSHFEVKGQKWR